MKLSLRTGAYLAVILAALVNITVQLSGPAAATGYPTVALASDEMDVILDSTGQAWIRLGGPFNWERFGPRHGGYFVTTGKAIHRTADGYEIMTEDGSLTLVTANGILSAPIWGPQLPVEATTWSAIKGRFSH